MRRSKVTIVGAGVPGLTLAILLAKGPFEITVVEGGPKPDKKAADRSARTTALMQGSLKILEDAGIWPGFQGHCTRLAGLSIVDDSTFPRGEKTMIREDFRADELGFEEFGYNVPLVKLRQALIDRVKAFKNIKILFKTRVDDNHKAIKDADLVIGADGRQSFVRGWAGIEADVKDYGQSAITCKINHTQSHQNVSVEFHRPGGPFTYVPYGENASAIVWVEKTDDADHFMRLSKDQFTQAIQDRTRGLLGQVTLDVEPESWPLQTLKAKRFIAPRALFVGEAAHVLSPIGAQGLNLSLRDVQVAAEVILNAAENGMDIGNEINLKAYQDDRARDIKTRYFGVDMLNQAVANNNLILRGVRRLGLKAIKFAGPLRTKLMQEGLAPRS